jgi:sorbitol-specific phosphotransferase system component IIC
MFVSFVTSVIVTLITTLTITATSLSRRGQNRIMKHRLKTADDAAAVVAGLPLHELRELDQRLHVWIDHAEL